MEDYYDDEGRNMDYDRFQRDWQAFNTEQMAIKFAEVANQEYGITAEQWNNTPDHIKKVMIEMYDELKDFQIMLENLEEWRDSMPI